MNIKYFLLLLCSFFGLAHAAPKKIIAHIDVNRTIIAEDPAGGRSLDDVLIYSLAEQCVQLWNNALPHPVSYVDYVFDYVFPGPKSDKVIKKYRLAMISSFVEYLGSTSHHLYASVVKRLEFLRNKLVTSPRIIFPSFYRMLDYLEQSESAYSIVLRTFGKDLDRTMEEIHSVVSRNFFSWRGKFKNGVLEMKSLHTDEVMLLHDAVQMYQFLKETTGHVAIQDDWPYWNSHGERSEYGKLFPIDRHDADVLTVFVDDNAEPKNGIVNPRCARTNNPLNVQELIDAGYVRVADTIDAIEDDDYFVSHLSRMVAEA